MKYPSSEPTQQKNNVLLQRLAQSEDVDAVLSKVLDVAIGMTGADIGILQRYDDADDTLQIVASRGFSDEALAFFRTVRRDTNTTCAVALTRRMHIFVGDVSESYLFVGSPELEVLRRLGIAAAQSTPFISSTGRFWGVVSTYFRETQAESSFDHLSLNRLAVQVADSLGTGRHWPRTRILRTSKTPFRRSDHDGADMMQMLRTHAFVIIDRKRRKTALYVSPDELLKEMRRHADTQHNRSGGRHELECRPHSVRPFHAARAPACLRVLQLASG